MNVDEAIAKLNARLKAGAIRVKVRKKGARLFLRATFPPKPGESTPKQRDLGLGYSANPSGLKLAEAKAKELAGKLESGTFSWAEYAPADSTFSPPSGKTVAEWRDRFCEHYFESRERSPAKLSTYAGDYECVYNKLNGEVVLTGEYLKQAILAYSQPDSRQRKRWVLACQKLGEFAELGCDLRSLAGSYSPQKVSRKDLPSDLEIASWFDKLPSKWDWAYKAIALYGIRPHELWYLNPWRLSPECGILEIERKKQDNSPLIQKSKTGSRPVYPSDWQWHLDLQLWQSDGMEGLNYIRSLKGKNNKTLGGHVSRAFKEIGIPWNPLLMRHAYSARLAAEGVDMTIAAKWMGHSTVVHGTIYANFYNERLYDTVLEKLKNDVSKPSLVNGGI